MSIVGPVEARPADGLAIDFVVESDRAQLGEIVQRVRDGRLRMNIGKVSTLDNAIATFNATERNQGRRSSGFAREDSGSLSKETSALMVWLRAWEHPLPGAAGRHRASLLRTDLSCFRPFN